MKTLFERARHGESLGIDIVDIHGHLGRYGFTIPDLSAASLVSSMDRLGIDAILCSSMHCLTRYTEEGNEEIHAAMQAFPRRICGYISVYPGKAESIRRSVMGWLDKGFIGIKLHDSNGLPYTHPGYEQAYTIAEERCLPLLLHTWGEERQIRDIEQLAARFPNISFLLAHSGSERVHEYIRLSNKYPHVYLELAFSQARRGLLEHLVAEAGSDKVVWGSDCIFINQAQQLGRVIGADLSDAVKIELLGANARKILARAQQVA
ncbi:MAG TPA: amidohydrolase family protein [bacterium]|jgi:predicted TIM-barrel fold metal-dependent hydrolase|nr:amidohydrolase family protein [bacterium]HNT64960.1 amidohydrolase family protein [bacterium]HOX84368.1 amidohydrolase family protein [bacterium]HPG46035.1 amidohydrolase family protein [bacterium]HPM97857.1 amidohydrolase family protein [bacterium]